MTFEDVEQEAAAKQRAYDSLQAKASTSGSNHEKGRPPCTLCCAMCQCANCLLLKRALLARNSTISRYPSLSWRPALLSISSLSNEDIAGLPDSGEFLSVGKERVGRLGGANGGSEGGGVRR